MNSEESQLLQVRGDGGATLSIAYRFHEPERNRPVYVWFCGFGSEMGSLKAEEVARWAADAGAGCLRFDYSGHVRDDDAVDGPDGILRPCSLHARELYLFSTA